MQIKLLSIHCTLNDEIDKDEIFLKYKGKKIWPGSPHKSINSGERLEIDMEFKHDPIEDLIIELWDFDFLSKNDLLGTFFIKLDEEDIEKINKFYSIGCFVWIRVNQLFVLSNYSV